MPINTNSRYVNNKIVAMEVNGKVRPTLVIEPPDELRINYSTYVWQDGDQIEYLSWSAYGDEQSWWVIANANPEILYWNNLPRGTKVRVPSV
jgi:phage tail protein X